MLISERGRRPLGESVQYTCELVCASVCLFVLSTAFALKGPSLFVGGGAEMDNAQLNMESRERSQPVEVASCCRCMPFLLG